MVAAASTGQRLFGALALFLSFAAAAHGKTFDGYTTCEACVAAGYGWHGAYDSICVRAIEATAADPVCLTAYAYGATETTGGPVCLTAQACVYRDYGYSGESESTRVRATETTGDSVWCQYVRVMRPSAARLG